MSEQIQLDLISTEPNQSDPIKKTKTDQSIGSIQWEFNKLINWMYNINIQTKMNQPIRIIYNI